MPSTRFFAAVRVGETLPGLEIPITSTLIVGGALASRDFTPVHHDRAAAQAQGMSDVFMNILTTNGLRRTLRHRLGRARRDPARGRDQARRAEPAR